MDYNSAVTIAVHNFVKLYWSLYTSLNLSSNAFLKSCHESPFVWSSVHALLNSLAGSVKRRTAIFKQSECCHLPTNAALSMLANNSSSGVTFFAPDHFGTMDIRDNNLCILCNPLDIYYLNLSSSAFESASSCLNIYFDIV